MNTIEQLKKDIEEVKQELNATDEELSMAISFVITSLFDFSSNLDFKERLKERLNITRELKELVIKLPESDREILAENMKKTLTQDKTELNKDFEDRLSEFVKTGKL